MELEMPAQAVDFNFDSACSSPYITAPSSPKRFGEFYSSAPTSPRHASAFYHEFNNFSLNDWTDNSSSSSIPIYWAESLGEPKSNQTHQAAEEDDFEFDFGGQLGRPSLSAEDLFDGGKIRPLKPPPRSQIDGGFDEFDTRRGVVSPPRSPRSSMSRSKKMYHDTFSPRQNKRNQIEQVRKGADRERGRERVTSNSGRRGTRSLSPFRISEFVLAEQQQQEKQQGEKISSLNSKAPASSSSASSKGYRKWRLRDFLLFRSASEGRGTEKDHLRKYSILPKNNDDLKNASCASTGSSVPASSSRSRGPISAHELHYTTNRAASKDLRKKTFLPYKQSLLGWFNFNPTVQGIGSSTHG